MSLRIVVTLAVATLIAVTTNACAWWGCIDNPCRANGGTWVDNDDEKCGGHCDYPEPSSSSSGWSSSDARRADAGTDAVAADTGPSDAAGNDTNLDAEADTGGDA